MTWSWYFEDQAGQKGGLSYLGGKEGKKDPNTLYHTWNGKQSDLKKAKQPKQGGKMGSRGGDDNPIQMCGKIRKQSKGGWQFKLAQKGT